jgi:hypothetical protein
MTDALYIADDELAQRLGIPAKKAREAFSVLDHDPRSGFPPRQKLWDDKRYWPAVRKYFDRINMLE